jgi:hypothetical protein
MGREIWNAWINEFTPNTVNFSGINFTAIQIDFSGFEFPSTPKKDAPCVNFSRCIFGNNQGFRGAKFGENARFDSAIFGKNADFSRSVFGNSATFGNADLSFFANFSGAKFGSLTSFVQTQFGPGARFRGASFGESANFVCTTFHGWSDFSAATEKEDPENSQFSSISFEGSKFKGDAEFTGRKFKSTTNFGPSDNVHSKYNPIFVADVAVEFHGLALFHGCEFHQDTNFDSARFLAPPSQGAARSYRTLKLAMEKLKATREEQKFFRLEMKAEHPSLTLGKRWASTLYNLFSDYGFSLWRPLAWLIAFSFIFGIGYGILADACAAESQCAQTAWAANTGSAEDRTSAVIKYTLASVSPVPGLDKMQTELRAPLFGQHGWIPITALALEIFHKITSLIMVFLFALALRNLFKMKS